MKTFLDSGVLLTAWKGKDAEIALNVMEDPAREFYSSYMVRLELLPKPSYERRTPEVEFYQLHLNRVRAEEPRSDGLSREAMELAKRYGLAAVDAAAPGDTIIVLAGTYGPVSVGPDKAGLTLKAAGPPGSVQVVGSGYGGFSRLAPTT